MALNEKPEEALRLLDGYLRRRSAPDIDVLLFKAHVLDMMNQFAAALKLYKAVLRLAPNDPQALIDLGDHCGPLRSGRLRALQYYNKAIKHLESGSFHHDSEDEFVSACVNKADALVELGRLLEAAQCIVGGLGAYPFDLRLFRALERVRNRHEGTTAAGKVSGAALPLDKNSRAPRSR